MCEAIDIAREEWVRVMSGEGCYDISRPNGTLPEPTWPDRSFESIITTAYKGRIITDFNHAILRELRGEV
jgi:hypothetical protein